MALNKIKKFKINGTIIDFIPFYCKDMPSLQLEWLDNLIRKYDQLHLTVF
jgi:hypothetical protein